MIGDGVEEWREKRREEKRREEKRREEKRTEKEKGRRGEERKEDRMSRDVTQVSRTLKRPLIKRGLSGPCVSTTCPAAAAAEDLCELSPPLPGVLPSEVFLPAGPDCMVRTEPADDPKGLPCPLLCLECLGEGFLPSDDDPATTPVGVELKSYSLTDFSLSGAELPDTFDLSLVVGHDFRVLGNMSLDHVLPLCSSAITSACLNTRIGSLDTLLGSLGLTVRYWSVAWLRLPKYMLATPPFLLGLLFVFLPVNVANAPDNTPPPPLTTSSSDGVG